MCVGGDDELGNERACLAQATPGVWCPKSVKMAY